MRGGLFTGHEAHPYSDADLAREFTATHALGHLSDVVKGWLWTARRLDAPPGALITTGTSPADLAAKLRARPYSDTDAHSEFADRWRVYWETYEDGPHLVAQERFAENPAHYARRTPAELRDCLREHEAVRKARQP